MSAYFANRIKENREKNGLTQKQLGEMIGVDDTLISKYEASEAMPPFDKVMKMASIFHITSEELMGVRQNVEKKYNANGERILNIENSEVVRRQFMSRVGDESVTITPDGIAFSAKCIQKWENVEFIHIIVDKPQRLLIIRKSTGDDLDAQRWCRLKDGKMIRRKVTGREFATRLYKYMKWDRGYSHKISGYIGENEANPEEKLWYFELSEAEAVPLMSKTRHKMGVKDTDISISTLERLNEIEKEKNTEKEKRQKAKEEGKDPGPMKQYVLYPDDWGQYTFGLPVSNRKEKAKVRLEDGEKG